MSRRIKGGREVGYKKTSDTLDVLRKKRTVSKEGLKPH